MILILAGGGNEAKQFAKALESEKPQCAAVSATFISAVASRFAAHSTR